MDIKEFISKYRNHPVLFVGTGVSLRYLDNSYTWDGLLKKIAYDLKGNVEFYLDIKSRCEIDGKYELIRAQLLSIFIHNPIIFLGYAIGDENIKSLLKTIFTYVEPNSDDAKNIRDNFLLVEYEEDSDSHEICEHDIDLEGFSTIRINKVKTDDFIEVYKALSDLALPISAMDVRKVQSVVKEIYSGGNIKVNITEDLDSLHNNDKIIAIGSSKTINYQFQSIPEMMANYFNIIDESNDQLLKLINKLTINHAQWFSIFAFSKICHEIERADDLKQQQRDKIVTYLNTLNHSSQSEHDNIKAIIDDDHITRGNKLNAVFWSIYNENLEYSDIENFLENIGNKKDTQYRRLLCVYDFKKYDNSLQI